ncbi:ATP-grasp domain-containing protein [Nonomuraea sp. NPDC005650]|uniref:ATP-grasp domain-containing protein n=1 Tax=Nonomuraea sp. NPDC005650 TaxID=3157045 RepID=UPI0033A7F6D6
MNLLFIESNTTGSGMLAFGKAAELGFTPVLATGDPARYAGLDETDVKVVVCDTNTPAELARELDAAVGDIAGVTTTSEFYVEAVAQTAASLGLPGNTPEAVARCRNKGRMRAALAAAALPSPAFAVIERGQDLDGEVLRALARIALPCVVKPVDDTGSSSVALCSTPAEVVAHCRTILAATTNVRGQPSAGASLIEGYLEGPEFSVEVISSPAGHRRVGITAKRVTHPPAFVERGHIFPAPVPAESAAVLTEATYCALDAVGVTHGVTHTEIKLIDSAGYVIEVNARPAGGMIPEVIAQSCGFELLGAHLGAACGLGLPEPPGAFNPAGIAFLLASPETLPAHEARLAAVCGLERARSVPGVTSVVVTAAPGSVVRPARSSYDRLGYVIATSSSYDKLDRALATALGSLRPVFATGPIGAK